MSTTIPSPSPFIISLLSPFGNEAATLDYGRECRKRGVLLEHDLVREFHLTMRQQQHNGPYRRNWYATKPRHAVCKLHHQAAQVTRKHTARSSASKKHNLEGILRLGALRFIRSKTNMEPKQTETDTYVRAHGRERRESCPQRHCDISTGVHKVYTQAPTT